eukprot:CAMPEP_0204373490 /NCGR_PEP_ID=MMETSP0469-20131031/48076_1 /ASSEMBLY_ACC=CAM_ASM_000384 /TAXON_ID=2969 /ORGANISM="Oxyrrhis marina" /LENGTH=352 /DNA_ID=CAMNT_0051363971 /DNA_START=21 /DNA_END=1076 /DNA_ORIENTATION=-
MTEAGGLRAALVLANSDYQTLAKLLHPVPTGKSVASKLRNFGFQVHERYDCRVADMREGVAELLTVLDRAALQPASSEPGLVIFVFNGHGKADRLSPVDAQREVMEETFSVFDDFINLLLARFGGGDGRPCGLPGCRIMVFLDTCRTLLKKDKEEFEVAKTRAAARKKQFLPKLQHLMPDLKCDGDELDLALYAHLEPESPRSFQFLFCLSCERTKISRDGVFLRALDAYVGIPDIRLSAVLQKAKQQVERGTCFKQVPRILEMVHCDVDWDTVLSRPDGVVKPRRASSQRLRRNPSRERADTSGRRSSSCGPREEGGLPTPLHSASDVVRQRRPGHLRQGDHGLPPRGGPD